ncbi:hypothetical protein NpPPO83_00007994 [Neofusicoccum parvum]|uniref:Uncharacterized protein n=1 Tax=Neofusicoccum parvum TaxID=310453 RepID=A0ACB5SL88_9PEZI|nr:hypothetical protein NpPPO83_00007994 [Neofusicoccum parvum]
MATAPTQQQNHVPSPLPSHPSSSPSTSPSLPPSPPIPPRAHPSPLHITLTTLPRPPTTPSTPLARFTIQTATQHAGADGSRAASLMRGARAALDDAAGGVGAALALHGLTPVDVSTVERAWAVAGRGGWFRDRGARVERAFVGQEAEEARGMEVRGERVVEAGFASDAALMVAAGVVERAVAVGVEALEVRFCNREWRRVEEGEVERGDGDETGRENEDEMDMGDEHDMVTE